MSWDFSSHAGQLRARALSIHAIVTFPVVKGRPSSIYRCGRQRVRRQAWGGIRVRRWKRHGNRIGIWSRVGTGLGENVRIGGAHPHRRGGSGRRLPCACPVLWGAGAYGRGFLYEWGAFSGVGGFSWVAGTFGGSTGSAGAASGTGLTPPSGNLFSCRSNTEIDGSLPSGGFCGNGSPDPVSARASGAGGTSGLPQGSVRSFCTRSRRVGSVSPG